MKFWVFIFQYRSYLDLAEFIQYSGANGRTELHQLWRRIIFNLAVSNTDDFFKKNHGFIIKNNGWHLSPAYDIDPSTEKGCLSMNIDTYNKALDFNPAKSVGEYFQLNQSQMDAIILEVKTVIATWKKLADEMGISRAE